MSDRLRRLLIYADRPVLGAYDNPGWKETFYTTGMEHSPTSATGTPWERTPWRATQRAAWEALSQREEDVRWRPG